MKPRVISGVFHAKGNASILDQDHAVRQTQHEVEVLLDQENRIAAPFQLNESPLDLLRRATQAGASEVTLPREWGDWATRAAMPSLRIPDFHMSSVSQAQ